jgi:phosphoglycerate dehydrogenase-like enzyme
MMPELKSGIPDWPSVKKCLYVGWLPPSGDAKVFLESHGIELLTDTKDRHLTEGELLAIIGNADATLAGGDPYTKRVIDSAPKLKIIARAGVGYDKVDVQAATAKRIYVTTSPVVELAQAMAEHTMALALGFVKRIPQRDREVRSGIWEPTKWWGRLDDLYHLTLGLLGLGRIGVEVAKRARAFGMNVIYYDLIRRKDIEGSLGIEYVSFDQLLSRSDILSLHAPLTPQTKNIIDAKALSRLKSTAILVNTARGALVDERALADVLRKGQISGACLDVFTEEPLPPGHVFYKLEDRFPNLILTPHSGTGVETTRAMLRAASEEIVTVLEGGTPRYAVNKFS